MKTSELTYIREYMQRIREIFELLRVVMDRVKEKMTNNNNKKSSGKNQQKFRPDTITGRISSWFISTYLLSICKEPVTELLHGMNKMLVSEASVSLEK